MQRPGSEWIISGMAARVASGSRYVTNFSKGGHPKTLSKVLLRLFSYDEDKASDYKRKLKKIALTVAETLEKRFPGLCELGLDFGIESDGHIWFIEANTRPAHKLFTKLPDKEMLYRIRRYKRFMEAR